MPNPAMLGLVTMSPSSRRAWIEISSTTISNGHARVALLAEGVDRNRILARLAERHHIVALLAEGVDRNIGQNLTRIILEQSPSSRRAWIEIGSAMHHTVWEMVALLAEGVDRNCKEREERHIWPVALLAEGVDRNVIFQR